VAHLRSCVAVRPLRLRGLVLCVSFVLVGVIVGPAVAADQYTVVDLAPAQTVAYYGGPAAINASGTVAGSSGSPMRAFRYGTGLQTLGVLGGGASAESYAYGINTAGWVVGWSATGKNSPGPAHAFRHNGVSMTDLGVIKKGGFSAAYDINDQNLVVGETSVTGATHAFKYDTQLRDLGTLPGYLDSRGYGVNASGKIVGRAYGGTVVRAFLHDGTTMRDLGTLGGIYAEAYDINDTDVVVGYSSNGVATHAFRYQGTTMTDIAPTVAYAVAYAVNNAGDIVGTTSTSPSGNLGRAFLYRDGQLVDLNTLIPTGSGWILTDAADINDQGQITGIGTHNGERRTYRLDLTNNGLLERYAPELRYHQFETYRADSVATITDNYIAGQYTNRLLDANGTTIAAANPADPSPETLALGFLGANYASGLPASVYDKIDEEGSTTVDFQRMHTQSQYANRVYGRVVPGSGSTKILQYWFFYYYNPKTYLGFGAHEGDWEMIQLKIDAISNNPLEATYSQHHDGERCDWIHVPRTASRRPIVYSAEGSHANYLSPGYHFNLGAEDYTSDDGEHVVPAVSDITAAPSWVGWIGQWGGSDSSPTGPSQKDQWNNAEAWAAPFGCTEGQVFLSRPSHPSSSQPNAPRVTRSEPSKPVHIEGTLVRKQMLVRYRLANAADAGKTGTTLLVSVQSANKKLVPITQRYPIRKRAGVVRIPTGLGPEPYTLSVAVIDDHGAMSAALDVRVAVHSG
jgi:probable HAF family extracellular repeat protein